MNNFNINVLHIRPVRAGILASLLFVFTDTYAQDYTSYLTGNSSDVLANSKGGVCLMGGASEDDEAMKWFLDRANGGDVLVLRATGADGYNNYMFSSLGVTVNSVETIVCNSASASNDPYVLQKINQAEAIWFAGGDQWDYVSFWRSTALNLAIQEALDQRNIAIGGTSAGMAIQGAYYFSAQNGTVTSATAMNNPYGANVTVDGAPFITNTYLSETITDTHFDNPDRKGRLTTFLARIYTDSGVQAKAIACDEYTAVCIGPDGIAKVYGGYPTYDDNAYFIQTNCDLGNPLPETCVQNTPLTWSAGGQALLVYQIKGESSGSRYFDLNTWATGSGGTWFAWEVSAGVFSEQSISNPVCAGSVEQLNDASPNAYPNPVLNYVTVELDENEINELKIQLLDALGRSVEVRSMILPNKRLGIDLSPCDHGMYSLHIEVNGKIKYLTLTKQ
ncbi:MAG: Cyanophycinase [Bacteroidota bacterium]